MREGFDECHISNPNGNCKVDCPTQANGGLEWVSRDFLENCGELVFLCCGYHELHFSVAGVDPILNLHHFHTLQLSNVFGHGRSISLQSLGEIRD